MNPVEWNLNRFLTGQISYVDVIGTTAFGITCENMMKLEAVQLFLC